MASFPQPCVYCQLDEEGETDRDEVFFVPETPDERIIVLCKTLLLILLVQEIFNAFSNAAMQNPDPEEGLYFRPRQNANKSSDDDGNDDFIYNVDEVELGAQQVVSRETVFDF